MLEHAKKLEATLAPLQELVGSMSDLSKTVATGTSATLTDMNDIINWANTAKQSLIEHHKAYMAAYQDNHEYVMGQFDEFLKRAQVIVDRLNTKATT